MKRVINKLIVLFFVFIGTLAIMFFKAYHETDKVAITMGKASIPTISMRQSDTYINMLYGYLEEMEPGYMRNSITPVPSDGKVKMTVNNCGNMIKKVKYSLYDMTDGEKCKNIVVEDWNYTVETTDVEIDLHTLLAADTEYILVINLETDRHESINYYTRVDMISNPLYNEQQEFVCYFSESTLDKTKAEELISYIEPNSSEENTNLGKVNINSSFQQLTWGNLAPERVAEPQIVYNELIGDIGSYTLKYRVVAKNDYDTEQYYNVTEFFRVKKTDTDMYLLDYERTMEQIFGSEGQSVTSSRVNMGIDSDLEVSYATNSAGSYIAFEKENSLWLMNTNENIITPVFSFYNSTLDVDARDNNDEHEIKVIDVSDDGDVEFLVYGYMNRGEHEGLVGVSLYKYSGNTNLVKETLFIPFAREYQILKEMIGKLLYVNSSDVMYIMLNDCIYSIDLTGNEYVEIISGLKDGNYAINKNNNTIAWEKDMSNNGSDSIIVMNLENDEEFTIDAAPGSKIKVEGFLGEDIAYGIAEESRIVTDQNGICIVPMGELKIVDMNGNEQKSYSRPGYYFTSSEVIDNMINLDCVQYDETGTVLQAASGYQIFGNDEEEDSTATVTTINTDLKQLELVINFAKKITKAGKLQINYPGQIKFDDTNTLSLRNLVSENKSFYVYGHGRVCSISDNVADAIIAAQNVNGVVIGDKGRYIWAKCSRQTENILEKVTLQPAADVSGYVASCVNAMLLNEGVNADVSAELGQGKPTIEVINSHVQNGTAVDLTGCSLEDMLYFVDKGKPVLGMLENGNCVLIVGYNFYNAMLLNPSTGEVYRQGLEETTEQFKQYGNRFVCITQL